MTDFTTWRTITLGTYSSATELRNALWAAGVNIMVEAEELLDAISPATTQTEIELVLVSLTQLRLFDDATLEQVYDRAQERGLHLCPAEVGPQLRLQYTNQLKRDRLLVAMEPIYAPCSKQRHIFRLIKAGASLWLDIYPDRRLKLRGHGWVFCRSSSTAANSQPPGQ